MTLARLSSGPDRERLAAQLERARDLRRTMEHLPLSDGEAIPQDLAGWYYEWLAHSTYDDYWRDVDGAAEAYRIQVPTLQVGATMSRPGYWIVQDRELTCGPFAVELRICAWHDRFVPGQLALDAALRTHSNPSVRDSSRFVIGRWTHGTYLSHRQTANGERDFGTLADASARFMTPLILDWFDLWLKPASGRSLLPRVRYFATGENQSHDVAEWPPPARPLGRFLRGTGRANTLARDGVLAESPPSDREAPDSYRYDPFNPVPTTGGAHMAPEGLGADGFQDQAEVEARDDVLVYTSGALISDTPVAGPPTVILHASTSAVDTDFAVKLVDVERSAYCLNVSEVSCARATVTAMTATSCLSLAAHTNS